MTPIIPPPSIRTLAERLLPLRGFSESEQAGYRLSAVLILLFPRRSETHFLLIRRPESSRRHAGQISLPGGVVETGDASLWHTALRETQEELGVDPALVVPVGRLPSVQVQVSGYAIVPFIGWTPWPPLLDPNPHEVAGVFEVPLTALTDRRAIEEEEWDLRGSRWIVTFYRLDGHAVWGATGRILTNLAVCIDDLGLDRAPGSVREVGPGEG